jgi:hypothetical protein
MMMMVVVVVVAVAAVVVVVVVAAAAAAYCSKFSVASCFVIVHSFVQQLRQLQSCTIRIHPTAGNI